MPHKLIHRNVEEDCRFWWILFTHSTTRGFVPAAFRFFLPWPSNDSLNIISRHPVYILPAATEDHMKFLERSNLVTVYTTVHTTDA